MTTHIQTLHSTWSADMSITKEEIIDVDTLSLLLKSEDISSEDQAKLRVIKRKLVRGRYLDTTYKLGKNIKSENAFLGRLCALRGIGLQTLPREIRSALAKEYYFDVDMVSAHPTLCVALCEKYNIVCKYQKELLEKREHYMELMGDELGLERGRVKERINALYFGYDTASQGMPDFFQKLHCEVIQCRKLIIAHEDWIDHLKFLKKQDNYCGKAFSYILQTIERSCLLELDKSATKHKRSLDVYIHDGGLIQKLPGEKKFPDELLREFEKDILANTGFQVKLSVKPLETTLDVEKDDDIAYQQMKEEFEKHCFKINNPACYVRLYQGEITFLDWGNLAHIYGNKFVNKELFIHKWKSDPNILTYETLDFLPELQAPDDTYNIWRGFPCKAVEGDVSVIQEVLRIICNSDEKAMEYIENWLSHLFQKPYEKPGVAIVVQSDEEGTGKDTFWDFIGTIVGTKMFFNTSRPEDCVFGRFNGSLKECLLLKFEEANFETNKKNEDGLKSLITSTKMTFESKNENAITMSSYTRTTLTSNHQIPFVVSDGQRRFMMVKASPERKGDLDFWTKVHTTLATEEARNSYYHYLLKKDISSFNPRNFPMTSYAKEVLTSSRPIPASFFQKKIEISLMDEVESEVLEWKARELMNSINEHAKYPMNDTRFGKEMKKFHPVLEKVKGRAYASYKFETNAMMEFLKTKGWWVEL